jgi:hypothetical protein
MASHLAATLAHINKTFVHKMCERVLGRGRVKYAVHNVNRPKRVCV